MAFYQIGSTYSGRECKKCGGRVRYKNSKRCVACKHELSKSEWERNKARQQVEQRHEIEAA